MFAEENMEGLPEEQIEESVASTVESSEISEAPTMEAPTMEAETTDESAADAKAPEAIAPAQKKREPKQRDQKQRDQRPGDQRPGDQRPGDQRQRRDKGARNKGGRNNERGPRKAAPLIFKRFVVVRWSGRREPADDMFWAEAKVEGDWIVISEFEQVRSRKEILTRLQELPNGLVAFDFPFSYPAEFMQMLQSEGISDWRSLARTVREELKKNTDDGTRRWIERIGKYRESKLDAPLPERDFRGRLARPLPPPYEQQSIAERYRRTDHTVRRAANRHLISPVQIGYNKLTSRYEFTDPQGQGRAALLGLSMFEQLLETREDVAVWPMMAPKLLTIVEVLPWVFTQGERVKPEDFRKQISLLEDRGWEIPSEAIDLAARNTDAQNAFRTLIGMIKTESREDRMRRPMRDYLPQFYADQQVQLEGWFYSVGYRLNDEKRDDKKEKPSQNDRQQKATAEASNSEEQPTEVAADVQTEAPSEATFDAPAEQAADTPTES